MLRKTNPAASSARGGAGRARDDNEKASKLKRQKDAQTKAIFFCLGILAFLGVIAKVEVNHVHKFTSKHLRTHRPISHYERSMEEAEAVEVLEDKNPNRPMEFLPPHSLYKLEVPDIFGDTIHFSRFQGMVTLVVNVACNWGKTQVSYTELAELQKMYRSKGFSVLAFPISDFHQELGSNEEILSYVRENFPQVDFPIFGLSSLEESPVYQSIRKQKPEASVRWNFYKFLIDRKGRVVEVFDLKVNPLQLTDTIEALLNDPSQSGGQKLVVA